MIEKVVQKVIKVQDKIRKGKRDEDLTYQDNNNNTVTFDDHSEESLEKILMIRI